METNETQALIIDDEKDICYLLSSVLKKKHIASNNVNTLKDAEKILAGEKPGIIFLDNHLPDGLGVDFMLSIKKLSPASKIVMISAHDTNNDRVKAYHQGADYFIGKPFSIEMINKAVDFLSPQGLHEA